MTEIDLVVFEVAGTKYAADLGQVRRVGRSEGAEQVAQVLGQPFEGQRALFFEPSVGVEKVLSVDKVHGVSRVPVSSLRRMPRAAHAAPFSVGAWLDGDEAVLLIDLCAI